MTIMITGRSVAQEAPAGTRIGNLRVFNSGVAVASHFLMQKTANGLFAISADGALVTGTKGPLPVGHYALKITALATTKLSQETGRFLIEVTPPSLPPPPPPPPAPPPAS